MQEQISHYFREFHTDISSIEIPQLFNFPFVVDTHSLCEIAINELQNYLETTTDFTHDFGIQNNSKQAIGKMFGVLVVKCKKTQKLGYLCAYSGKLANSNHVSFFVPPVFDMLNEGSFFLEEEVHLNTINAKIEAIEKSNDYQDLITLKQITITEYQKKIENKKKLNKEFKNNRKAIRGTKQLQLSQEEFDILNEDLIKQSLRDKHELNVLIKSFENEVEAINQLIATFESKINQLKEERKFRSNALQRKLFQSYSFLNAHLETKNLLDIFETNLKISPPAGAGECCAPKLLHFAYQNQLQPLAIAEFWWGASPKSQIRKHKQIYPACWGKCQPILSHMLQGLQVKDNPLLKNPAENKELEIIYDDPYLVVINKPNEFLSVPGIHIKDSVYERIQSKYPEATGPLIVHRLDMSTSGIMILAKNKDVHQLIQKQFIKHQVEKKYVALLDGVVDRNKGIINLPLRVDLDDRPKQVVCYQHGKQAITHYEVVEIINNKTRIHFYPITGRTHQLRMHSAHQLGLNAPIIGDDLYGNEAERLYLHAEELMFTHPITKEKMHFISKAPF